MLLFDSFFSPLWIYLLQKQELQPHILRGLAAILISWGQSTFAAQSGLTHKVSVLVGIKAPVPRKVV